MSVAKDKYGTDLRIYDNGGKTFDRYTIIPARWDKRHAERDGLFTCIGASENPFHPQGFGQHSTAMPGPHLGKRIHWNDLPADVQKFAKQSFPEYFVTPADVQDEGPDVPRPARVLPVVYQGDLTVYPEDNVSRLEEVHGNLNILNPGYAGKGSKCVDFSSLRKVTGAIDFAEGLLVSFPVLENHWPTELVACAKRELHVFERVSYETARRLIAEVERLREKLAQYENNHDASGDVVPVEQNAREKG